MDKIDELIKFTRQQQGLTLRELSEKSGLPITTIHNYELGVEPTLKKADQLFIALGIKLVIGRAEQETYP